MKQELANGVRDYVCTFKTKKILIMYVSDVKSWVSGGTRKPRYF